MEDKKVDYQDTTITDDTVNVRDPEEDGVKITKVEETREVEETKEEDK